MVLELLVLEELDMNLVLIQMKILNWLWYSIPCLTMFLGFLKKILKGLSFCSLMYNCRRSEFLWKSSASGRRLRLGEQ